MKKITIMALHLGYGGIEKCISDFANTFCDDYEIEIVSTYKLYEQPVYKLNKKVRVKYLINELKPNRKEFWDLLKKLRFIKTFKEGLKSIKILYLKNKLMKNYLKECRSDIIISTRIYHNNILSKYGNKSSIRIGWEHNHHNNNTNYYAKLIRSVKKLNYLVLVSKNLFKDYNKVLKNTNCRCVYIPNMIINESAKKSKLEGNNLITVSRLSKEKGIFDLIDVISLVNKEIKDLKHDLIGDGPLMDEVKAYIKEKNLENVVNILGFKPSSEVYKYLSKSSLYVMTSYTESFGIALLEAFSSGVPAIAFDSAQGSRELINDDNGYLIKSRNKELMAEQIIKYLSSPKEKKRLSKTVCNITKEYSQEIIKSIWETIFE